MVSTVLTRKRRGSAPLPSLRVGAEARVCSAARAFESGRYLPYRRPDFIGDMISGPYLPVTTWVDEASCICRGLRLCESSTVGSRQRRHDDNLSFPRAPGRGRH